MGVPSVTYSAASATNHVYLDNLNNTPVQVFVGRGNLYGFFVEDNSGEDIFVKVYDSANTNLAGKDPVFTFRVKADNSFGKDVNDSPYKFLTNGCVVVASKQRSADEALGANAAAQFWYVHRTFPNP